MVAAIRAYALLRLSFDSMTHVNQRDTTPAEKYQILVQNAKYYGLSLPEANGRPAHIEPFTVIFLPLPDGAPDLKDLFSRARPVNGRSKF